MMKENIYNLNEDTIPIFKNCFDLNGSPKVKSNIEWQFLENPVKKQYVDILVDEKNDRTAAIYAIFPVKFKIGKIVFLGAQSLDTITDVNYRGRGLFIKLAKDVYQKAKDDGVIFVYGFPNGNSIHGFKKKLEWNVLDPLPFLVKPLKSRYFTNRISVLKFLPNIKLSFSNYHKNNNFRLFEKNFFPDDVNRLWDNFSQDIEVAVKRDKEYLDWRYLKKPNESYNIVHCYNTANEYLGFVVYVVKEKHGGQIGYIMELIYNLDSLQAGQELLKFAIKNIKDKNADCILSWCLEHSPNSKIYKKNFFINIPKKIRPIDLHFGVLSFNERLKEILNKRDNWYISYSDSDTV